MPDRPLTIATYAAGASLAAITLVYVFGPTFFLDDDAANSSGSARKKGVVGLINPANDCFINSVLQALAGLPALRAHLIREVHRRKLDGPEMYEDLSAALEEERKSQSSQKAPDWKTVGLQQGLVTAGLKEVLDALNERPIYKKTISAQTFIRCVEQAFRTRVSRTQQDAQEFLQVIVERLAEEDCAARRVRRHTRLAVVGSLKITQGDDRECAAVGAGETRPRDSKMLSLETDHVQGPLQPKAEDDHEKDETIFPLEGKLESQVECVYCHFKPKPTVSSFLTLTLSVPHDSTSSTLSACFDQLLKQEHIEDFKCDRCRLEHAISTNERKMQSRPEERARLESDNAKLREAMNADPENPPKGVELPDLAQAPKRNITRYTRISSFPEVLAVHLSRSVWDPSAASSKNMAKVSFPETLPLGGLLDRKTYRLLGVVMHKGGHNSGHYESFRRQVLNPPFSTPASMGAEGVYSIRQSPAPSPRASAVSSPQLSAGTVKDSPVASTDSPALSTLSRSPGTPTSATPSISSGSSTLHTSAAAADRRRQHPPFESVPAPGLPTPPQTSNALPAQPSSTPSPASTSMSPDSARPRSSMRSIGGRSKKNKANDRWWRISDDKIKESKTSDVLGMQKEVYLLFYEIVPKEG